MTRLLPRKSTRSVKGKIKETNTLLRCFELVTLLTLYITKIAMHNNSYVHYRQNLLRPRAAFFIYTPSTSKMKSLIFLLKNLFSSYSLYTTLNTQSRNHHLHEGKQHHSRVIVNLPQWHDFDCFSF